MQLFCQNTNLICFFLLNLDSDINHGRSINLAYIGLFYDVCVLFLDSLEPKTPKYAVYQLTIKLEVDPIVSMLYIIFKNKSRLIVVQFQLDQLLNLWIQSKYNKRFSLYFYFKFQVPCSNIDSKVW